MTAPRPGSAARLAALGVLPPDQSRRAMAAETAAQQGTLAVLLAGVPDGVVLCDALLAPVRWSVAAGWLLCDGRWASTPPAAACREAAAAALDRRGVASVTFRHDGVSWEARGAPLEDARTPVCVSVRSTPGTERDALLRAAHDLKAPLHAIYGFGTLLLREQTGPLTAAQRQALESIAAETERLRGTLGALLEGVRTGTLGAAPTHTSDRPATQQATDLAALAQKTVARFSAAAAVRAVQLDACTTSTGAAAIAADDARTILENLVANALAAAQAGGLVRVLTEETAAGTISCRVEDDGPGVPHDLLEQIFVPGFRLLDRGGPDGTGLGLAIARELTTRAGGTLTAANRAAQDACARGAVLTLTLPRAAPAQRRLLHLAPVTSYSALARAHTLLDRLGAWETQSWENGVLSVTLPPGSDPRLEEAAAQHGLACWSA